MSQSLGFTTRRSSQHQHRPLGGSGRLALGFIQVLEQFVHRDLDAGVDELPGEGRGLDVRRVGVRDRIVVLEALDPETRMQVMQDARMQEEMTKLENRLLGKIAPVLGTMQQRAAQSDLERVAQKYPAFDTGVHGPLIEMFREKNPNCSVEQAFRAIAEPEELAVGSGRAPTIPPIANPSAGNAAPRYVPQPSQQTSPEQEVEQDRKRAFDLARSTNAKDRRYVGPAFDQLIRSKLGAGLPDTRSRR